MKTDYLGDMINKPLKGSVPAQIQYHCIGEDFQQFNVFFQLRSIQTKLQQLTTEECIQNATNQVIDTTLNIYDALQAFADKRVPEVVYVANYKDQTFSKHGTNVVNKGYQKIS